jgi:hypothetical protein
VTVLYFVTPAYLRYELTEVCLDQRRRVINQLARSGIEAHCVVIADDDNLDIARSFGFDTVERDNEWLGRRFNDGIEHAARQGADWIVPIGSDSWIDPWYFLPLPDPSMTRTSAMYAAVDTDRMATLTVQGRNGAGPYVIHRDRLPTSFRPAKDELKRYIDSSTIAGLRDVTWEWVNHHPLQYIGFRGEPHLTPYERLWKAWGNAEMKEPWRELSKFYPAELVSRARAAL